MLWNSGGVLNPESFLVKNLLVSCDLCLSKNGGFTTHLTIYGNFDVIIHCDWWFPRACLYPFRCCPPFDLWLQLLQSGFNSFHARKTETPNLQGGHNLEHRTSNCSKLCALEIVRNPHHVLGQVWMLLNRPLPHPFAPSDNTCTFPPAVTSHGASDVSGPVSKHPAGGEGRWKWRRPSESQTLAFLACPLGP